MLELRGISLWRSDRPVFDNLSLRLTGRRIGLIGSNGAGKSSLLRLVQGLLKASCGTVTFSSPAHRAETPASGKAQALRCGMVFQNPDHQILFPTVMEELCFGQIEQGVTKSNAEQSVLSLAQTYNATDLLGLATHELSEGQKQRLCILSVLADGPDLILLDEPFASLDRKAVRAMLQMLAAIPQPLIMASHALELFEGFDELVWLEKGVVIQQGSPLSVIAAYRASEPHTPEPR